MPGVCSLARPMRAQVTLFAILILATLSRGVAAQTPDRALPASVEFGVERCVTEAARTSLTELLRVELRSDGVERVNAQWNEPAQTNNQAGPQPPGESRGGAEFGMGALDGQPDDALAHIAFRGLCADSSEVSLEITDRATGKRVQRSISLDDVAEVERLRVLALATGALLRASWAELILTPDLPSERPLPPPAIDQLRDRIAANLEASAETADELAAPSDGRQAASSESLEQPEPSGTDVATAEVSSVAAAPDVVASVRNRRGVAGRADPSLEMNQRAAPTAAVGTSGEPEAAQPERQDTVFGAGVEAYYRIANGHSIGGRIWGAWKWLQVDLAFDGFSTSTELGSVRQTALALGVAAEVVTYDFSILRLAFQVRAMAGWVRFKGATTREGTFARTADAPLIGGEAALSLSLPRTSSVRAYVLVAVGYLSGPTATADGEAVVGLDGPTGRVAIGALLR